SRLRNSKTGWTFNRYERIALHSAGSFGACADCGYSCDCRDRGKGCGDAVQVGVFPFMTAIKLNGKRYVIPSGWMEVTTGQLIKLLEWEPDKDIADRDYLKLIPIFTGAEFTSMKADAWNESMLINIFGWVIFQPFEFKKQIPKVLAIAGKKVMIPRQIEELSIGQAIHLRR